MRRDEYALSAATAAGRVRGRPIGPRTFTRDVGQPVHREVDCGKEQGDRGEQQPHQQLGTGPKGGRQ
ncbi:hypothetical protein AB0O75_35525 [Streptomyces sp. NPDC088921]|uniref:hypothetical protein n=1 Tax=unclassified Streptomyces TaxID=2593676 RepID=UPI00344815CA